ncbi:hypothetical protein DAPPUDRAFT_106662 [Daphnia pulex]|uniref:THAP-type domain-containing protein n=1 Tax=Daphnia pulex TaxID=6669 RepID=E9GUN4_DAPPU|nr:hypothetical protein DAPPUDRAFT_106662 [Daphnia pulex]|eukprot:EFX76907.1 hypothetical protein DAPPUDRAFT_106662 [Daphnia pulex]
MGRVCSAPGCRTGYPLKKGEIQKVGPKPALFKAPKDPDLFKKWKQKIPRKEFVLKNSCYVCELHFLPKDVENTFSGLCNVPVPCDVTALKRVRNKLKPGLCLFYGLVRCPEHLSKKEKQQKKPPQKRDQSNSRKKRTVKDSSDVESADNRDPLTLNNQKRKLPDDDEESSSSQPKKSRLTDQSNEDIDFDDSDVFDMTEVFLDPSLVAEPDLTSNIKFISVREVIEYPSGWIEPFVTKAASIDFTLKSMAFFLVGKQLPGPSNTVPFETISDINSALYSFHWKKLCNGFKGDSSGWIKKSAQGFMVNGSWHSEQCLNICEDDTPVCCMCETFRENLMRTQRRIRARQLLKNSISKTTKSPRKNRRIEAYRLLRKKGEKALAHERLRVKRFFGIIRIANGSNEMPTTTTFLQLFRMIVLYYPTKKILRGANVDDESNLNSEERLTVLTNYHDWIKSGYKEVLYYPTKKILRGANVDDESNLNSKERLTVLTNYHDWIKSGYKENKKKQDAFRKFVKDILLDGIVVEKRFKCKSGFESVKGGLESMPKDFTAKDLTELKSNGYLKFTTLHLFKLLKAVEKEIQRKLDIGQMFRPNSFTDILSSLVADKLPQVGCEEHRIVFMTNIIIDFMCTRMKCIAKEKRLQITEEKRVKEKSARKEKKLELIN